MSSYQQNRSQSVNLLQSPKKKHRFRADRDSSHFGVKGLLAKVI